jgi:hypothetical protein
MDMDGRTIVNRFRQLESQRKSMDNVLQDIDHYVVPYRGEFYSDMLTENQVEWNRTQLYDSTAVVACDLLASQMHGNLTSPVTKWFGLRFRDEDTQSDPAAAEWLEDSEERLWQVLVESDFNNTAAEMYTDISSFGTSILTMEQKNDIEWRGLDFTALPVMDSYFEMGPMDKPYAIYRRLRYTKLELEARFNLPKDLNLDEDGGKDSSVDAKIEVVFCIYHRNDNPLIRDGESVMYTPTDRPIGYKYCLLRSGTELDEGGYFQFPGMVVRWDKVAGAKWGTSPAMRLLSDIRQLNELVAQTSEARAKVIDPPFITTSRGVIGDADLQPGGQTLVEEMDEIRPWNAGSDFVQADIERERLQQAIREGFFIDKLEFKDSPAMTATEVNMRYERMLRLMSPTLGRLQTDFLDPLIQNTFMIMLRQDQFLEMPESIADMELDIEYTGPMPRAQKAEVAMGIESWLMTIANLAELYPEMADVPDTDKVAATLGQLRGVPAKLLKTEDELKEIREARAAQQKAVNEIQMATAAGEAAQSIGKGAQETEGIEEDVTLQ